MDLGKYVAGTRKTSPRQHHVAENTLTRSRSDRKTAAARPSPDPAEASRPCALAPAWKPLWARSPSRELPWILRLARQGAARTPRVPAPSAEFRQQSRAQVPPQPARRTAPPRPAPALARAWSRLLSSCPKLCAQ